MLGFEVLMNHGGGRGRPSDQNRDWRRRDNESQPDGGAGGSGSSGSGGSARRTAIGNTGSGGRGRSYAVDSRGGGRNMYGSGRGRGAGADSKIGSGAPTDSKIGSGAPTDSKIRSGDAWSSFRSERQIDRKTGIHPHALVATNQPYDGGFDCNACRKSFRPGVRSYHCEACRYDECETWYRVWKYRA